MTKIKEIIEELESLKGYTFEVKDGCDNRYVIALSYKANKIGIGKLILDDCITLIQSIYMGDIIAYKVIVDSNIIKGLSDEETTVRLIWGHDPATAISSDGMICKIISDILVYHLGVSKESITMDSRIVEDLDADSLDCIYITMAFEETYNFDISDQFMETFKTVRDIFNYIKSKK